MTKKRLSLFFLALVCGIMPGLPENLPERGVPLLQNFAPLHYHNKGKVWHIGSAPNGIIYFAADGGLLEYDGKTWNSFRGSNGITRSVLVVNDSLIFTGSDLDFGLWKRNRHMGFDYTSLYPFQKEGQNISEEFWQIHHIREVVFFVSSRSIYIYKNEKLIKIATPDLFTGSYQVGDAIYLTDENNNLYLLEDFSLKKVSELKGLGNTEIIGISLTNSGLMIVTRDLGLYLLSGEKPIAWITELSLLLKTAKVFSFEKVGNNHFAFGTVLKGLYVANGNGQIIHHVNRQKGLPGNTVLSLHYTRAGRLWMGMDYGVSSLDMKNNFTTFYDYRGDFGTGYSALLKEGIFYLGTNQGLYRSYWHDLKNNREIFRFDLVPETEGQVWTLKNINNTILMGHDKGLFVVAGNKVEKIGSEEGVWTITTWKDFLLTGNYNGISIFRKSSGQWVFLKKMDLILGSCNQLVIENENILWVNIPNFGIIRAVINENLYPEERLIFTADTFAGNHIFLMQNKAGIHILTDTNQYIFDQGKKQFIHLANQIIFPRVNGQLAGVYLPVPLNSEYEFYPIYNGFALNYLAGNSESVTENFPLTLRKIMAFNNHEKILLYPGAKIPRHLNNIHIEWIIPNQNNVKYQFKLNTWDDWSPLSDENTFEILGLSMGNYQLSARAITNNSIVDQQQISFRIAAPWYLTLVAMLLYAIILGLGLAGIYRWQTISLKKQKKQMLIKQKNSLRQQTEKHRQEIMLLEQKRLQTEYDQLKKQLKSKTIELANKARDNEEKNRLLLTLKEKCETAQENPALFDTKWAEMQRILDSYLKNEDKTFEIQMDELHQEFFTKLREQCPDLSHNDLRMCAYLKIGLNSKEIAELLNIQPSSFYISRSRLRKKLNLKTEEDLFSYLNRV